MLADWFSGFAAFGRRKERLHVHRANDGRRPLLSVPVGRQFKLAHRIQQEGQASGREPVAEEDAPFKEQQELLQVSETRMEEANPQRNNRRRTAPLCPGGRQQVRCRKGDQSATGNTSKAQIKSRD